MSPSGQPRDTQRSRVYEAEHLVHRIFDRSVDYPVVEVAGSHLTLPMERKFAAIADIQRYVEAVLDLQWVRRAWPRRAALAVAVQERTGAAQATYLRNGCVMAVPAHRSGSSWALRELVILHELAHHLAADGEPDHGPAFVDRLITLVDGIVGPEAALLIRITMLDQGVRIG